MADLIQGKMPHPLRGRPAKPTHRFPKALAYSLAAHGLLYSAAVMISAAEWPVSEGVAPRTPELTMIARRPSRLESLPREIEPTTEIPIVIEVVDVLEEFPKHELPDTKAEEPQDPLLDVNPFEELELEPLPTPEVEPVPEEPVGEEPQPLRQLLESPVAVYPRMAIMRRLEGSVVLRMIFDASGALGKVELISSSGHGLLDRAAIAAARGYRFEEGEGRLTVSKTFTFRLP